MSNCKYAIVSGGDRVPYGSSGAYLPETIECDNPALSEDEFGSISCSDNCPYHTAAALHENEEKIQHSGDLLDFYNFDFQAKEASKLDEHERKLRHIEDLIRIQETADFWIKVKETNDFLKSKRLI